MCSDLTYLAGPSDPSRRPGGRWLEIATPHSASKFDSPKLLP